MKQLIIDTDPGVDDAQAILLALAHPDVQVEAITTVSGNVSIDLTTANARKHVSIELHGSLTRGQTVVDWSNAIGKQPNTEIIHEMDQERFIQLLENGLK